jgi:hypothetical protein
MKEAAIAAIAGGIMVASAAPAFANPQSPTTGGK